MADTIAIRVAVVDAETAVAALRSVGAEGDRSLRGLADASQRYLSITRGTVANLAAQLQDVVVQLQAGVNPLTVFVQQGSQIASAFGPAGVVIGAFGALVGAATGALVGFASGAREAAASLDRTISALDAAARSAENYATAIRGASAEQQKLIAASARLEREAVERELGGAVADIGAILRRQYERTIPVPTEPALLPRGRQQLAERAREIARRTESATQQLRSAAERGDVAAIVRLAEEYDLLGDVETLAAIQRLIDLARRVQVLRAAEQADVPRLQELGRGPSEIGAEIERQRRAAEAEARRAAEAARRQAERAQEAARREAERQARLAYQATLQLTIAAAERGEYDDARSLAARARAEKILEEDRRLRERLARERELEAAREARIFAAPFEEAARQAQIAFADAFAEILSGGKATFGELAETLGQALLRTAAQIPALLVTRPLTAAIEGQASALLAALQSGDLTAIAQSPLSWATLGSIAGGVAGGSTGALSGALGGLAGALIGKMIPAIGPVIGGFAGSLLGSLFGGIFGSSRGGNNRAGARIDLGAGLVIPGTDARSGENQRIVNAIIAEAERFQQTLARAGAIFEDQLIRIRLGEKTGAEIQVGGKWRAVGDEDQLRRVVLEEVERAARLLPDAVRAVLERTRGQAPEYRLQAVEFAQRYEELVRPAEAAAREFRRLNAELERAAALAERYGLSVEAVREAQRRAAEEAERELETQIYDQRDRIRATFGAVVELLEQTRDAIRIGPLSVLAPADQLAVAREQFERVAQRAAAGDLEARQQLAIVARQYLAEAREFGASGPVFQTAYADVMRALEQAIDATKSTQDRLLDLLPSALRDAQRPIIDALERQTRELVAAWQALRREIAAAGRVA